MSPTPVATEPLETPAEQNTPASTGGAAAAEQDESSRSQHIGGIYRGSDTFVHRGVPAGGPVIRTPDGEVTLNFVDADLREVVKAILGDTLGANYVIDPQVQGTVTLQTSQPVPGPALISVLESILQVNNATLVQTDGLYKIVPADIGPKGNGHLRSTLAPATQAPGAQVVVVPLKHISATEVEKLLAPFAPPGGVLRVDPRRNLVVLGGSRADVASMLDVIDTFDVDWLAGMSFGLFALHSTTAKTMVDELGNVFGDQTEGPLAGVVRFVPIERLNAVLVISPRSLYVDRAQSWIERLDVGESETPRIYVYYCENSRAEDIAAVLSQVFGQQTSGASTRPQAQLAPGLSPVTLQGQTGGQPDAPAANALSSVATQRSGNNSAISGGGSSNVVAGGNDDIKIIADKVKNALVILAKPSDYRTVETALHKLDIIPLQVLIEATILEVTLNDTLQYGVEWFFKYGSNKIALSQSNSPRISSIGSDIAASIFPGFSYVLSPGDSVKAVVNALDQVSDLNVLSSPQVFVLDNQTATLTVGQEVPIQTRSQQSTVTDTANIVNSIEYKDTGVILNVTPRVNAGGLVTMEISQEVSNVSNEASAGGIDSPTINQRKVETTVAVQGGETVALGGLITDRRENTSSGIPWLSRLPWIGWLFGTKSETAGRTELLVLITPQVVGGAEQARQVTRELRSRLRSIVPLEQRLQ
ncbi:MAG: type II secretion system secretin GspD [Rhodospirillales bacterium]|nr:type II secretion system secretin GspD [Rhodospirillales bacterium]